MTQELDGRSPRSLALTLTGNRTSVHMAIAIYTLSTPRAQIYSRKSRYALMCFAGNTVIVVGENVSRLEGLLTCTHRALGHGRRPLI